MARGRRDRSEEREGGLNRRCVGTGQSMSKEGMIRFVAGPVGEVVPDLAERLPGRGVWVTASRAVLEKSVKKRLFSRGLKLNAAPPEDLVETVAGLLLKRAVDSVALARKAGAAVCGFERCREALNSGRVSVLLAASDGAEGGKSKLRGLSDGADIVSALLSSELGLAFGRETVIHAALLNGGAADRALRDLRRLDGFRS